MRPFDKRWQVAGCSAVLIVLGAFLLPVSDAVAQRSERALTRQDVRDYIRLRIAIHQKQEEMKANADEYDGVIHAFFQWKSEYLQERGRSRESFNALERRIMDAETAMEMAADSAAYHQRRQQTRQARHIAPTRRDWPTVRPYLDALDHLKNYVALNRPDPPDLDALPSANE